MKVTAVKVGSPGKVTSKTEKIINNAPKLVNKFKDNDSSGNILLNLLKIILRATIYAYFPIYDFYVPTLVNSISPAISSAPDSSSTRAPTLGKKKFRKKTRSKQKNIRKDNRTDDFKPSHLQIGSKIYSGRPLTNVSFQFRSLFQLYLLLNYSNIFMLLKNYNRKQKLD